MAFMYDLILNFNKDYYNFYEWNESDITIHVKKISLIKVDCETFDDILEYEIQFSKEFLKPLWNKCEYFTKNGLKYLHGFLLSDSYRVMAIELDSDGTVKRYSSLLLDEEEEVLEMSFKLPVIRCQYLKGNKKQIIDLTREEKEVQEFLKEDIEKTNDLSKLKYLYYEYYEKNGINKRQIKKELLEEIQNNFNKKHLYLYNLIKVPLHQNNV